MLLNSIYDLYPPLCVCLDRNQGVGALWKNFRSSSEEEQQEPVPVQTAAACREGAWYVGTFSVSKSRKLQPSHAASSWNEGAPGIPPTHVNPGWRQAQLFPRARWESCWEEEVLPRRAAVVVCVYRVDTGDRNQWRVRILHYDVWADLRERPFYKLAYLHGGLLFWESLYHPAFKGEKHYSICRSRRY